MAAGPRHRTAARPLRRMAHSPLLYEVASAQVASTPSVWEQFRIRNIGLAAGRAFAASGQTAEEYGAASLVRAAKALSLNVAALNARQRRVFRRLAPVLALIPDLERWSREEREAVIAVVKAKAGPREDRYIHLLTRHTRLREALIRLGSPTAANVKSLTEGVALESHAAR